MGARSLTVFVEGESEVAVLYRQFDGYPTGHGKDLATYLSDKYIKNGISANDGTKMFNGINELAVRCIVALKLQDGDKGWDQPGNLYLFPARTRDVGEEYTYYIFGNPNEPITLKVFADDEEIFTGTPLEFLASCEKL